MGNNQTRPERGGGGSSSSAGHLHRGGPTRDPSERANIYSGRGHRGSRPDLSFLGINVSSVTPEEYVEARRETKAEREARRLEKERTARLKERERSMKEEHVDGGYLVTQGVYTGTEDFNKSVVRQLMIERRLAPFWRGLDDHSDTWTEYQIVCAARGLPIPAPDDIPPDDFLKPPHPSAVDSPKNASVSNLTVPIAGRSPSSTSDVSATLSPSHPAFSIPSPTTPTSPSASSSTFRTRSKTLASLTTSRNSSQTEVLPREIMLPNDPYVNGQPIEVALYKEAPECIICMLSYPPWINHTRCCDQPICSECFVQIKRPDPHPPEHEQPDAANPNPQPAADAETLVSEPSCCPYCQQAEFGVTYEPPPFRRGLVYAMGTSGPAMGSVSSAMSSTSSLNSNGSPQLGTAPTGRRRATSLAANSPAVITTDRVRPDWATKLANARNHAARRAAAATALHTAAYLMNSNGTGSENRSFTFTPRGRFSRNQGSGSPAGGETPTNGPQREDQPAEDGQQNRRRTRIDDLEDMMLMEAIRLSLAAEEDRKRKEDKDARKREKKKEKEAKKAEKAAEKAAKRSVYSNGSSASGSALSLSLPVIGRRRGNSASSVLKDSTIAEEPGKGKGIDRGIGLATASAVAHATGQTLDLSSNSASQSRETAPATSPAQPPPSPLPATNVPEKPSHLRHISNASSAGSSSADSGPGTPNNGPRASSSTLGSASGAEQGDESNTPDREGEANKDTESMFNFSSLAAMIGQDGEEEDSKDAARHVEYLEGAEGSHAIGAAKESTPTQEISDPLGESMATLKPNAPEPQPQPQPQAQTTPLITDHLPHVMVTPETPAAETSAEADSKQLGVSMGTTTYVQDVTQ